MATLTATKFKLSIVQPDTMMEAPEATFITVEGFPDVAKRIFEQEASATEEAVLEAGIAHTGDDLHDAIQAWEPENGPLTGSIGAWELKIEAIEG